MTSSTYIRMVSHAESQEKNARTERDKHMAYSELSGLIDKLSHAERIRLRTELENAGERRLLRSLFYDYSNQVWIEPVDTLGGLKSSAPQSGRVS